MFERVPKVATGLLVHSQYTVVLLVPFKPQPTLVYSTGDTTSRYSHTPLISKGFP